MNSLMLQISQTLEEHSTNKRTLEKYSIDNLQIFSKLYLTLQIKAQLR